MSGEKVCPMGCLGHGGSGVCPHCGDWHRDDFSCCTPTPPVPSEVAETTAGEREVEALAKEAEAQVWALADELCTTWHDNDGEHEGETPGLSGWLASRWACQDCYDTACTLVDAKWLTALLDRVRREEGERIAQAIEDGCDLPATPCRMCRDAALLARAASVGRGEGQ